MCHVRAAEKVFELRGPYNSVSGIEHDVFLLLRGGLVSGAAFEFPGLVGLEN